MNYNKKIKRCLDEDTIPGRSYLTEEQWADTALCSDTEIEKVICAANARANKEQDKMKDGEPRLIWRKGVNREVLAPVSTVCKTSPNTSVIKKPNRQEVGVRNSDIAKFGTKAERDTDLGQYIERRPKKIYEKTVEQKIKKHRRDLVRKNTGDIKE